MSNLRLQRLTIGDQSLPLLQLLLLLLLLQQLQQLLLLLLLLPLLLLLCGSKSYVSYLISEAISSLLLLLLHLPLLLLLCGSKSFVSYLISEAISSLLLLLGERRRRTWITRQFSVVGWGALGVVTIFHHRAISPPGIATVGTPDTLMANLDQLLMYLRFSMK